MRRSIGLDVVDRFVDALHDPHRADQIEKLSSEIIGRSIGATLVDVSAFLAETAITVRELIGLQPGDIIQTTKPVNESLIVRVEGRNKFRASVGRHKKNRAVKITGSATDEERL